VNDTDGVYGVQAHWAGWCFHTNASPRILVDWNFTPTVFWGAYVKSELQARVYPGYITVDQVTTDAFVNKLTGNSNELVIVATEHFSDGRQYSVTKNFTIANNASGIYDVGDYRVFVDTKGNTQIRACHIVD
jgi:hypothetical protein